VAIRIERAGQRGERQGASTEKAPTGGSVHTCGHSGSTKSRSEGSNAPLCQRVGRRDQPIAGDDRRTPDRRLGIPKLLVLSSFRTT
jgi:hypothetical protein